MNTCQRLVCMLSLRDNVLLCGLWRVFFGITTSVVLMQSGVAALASVIVREKSTPQLQSTLQTFRVERWTLAQQDKELVASGATSEQISAWEQQNATQLAAPRPRAIARGYGAQLKLQTLRPVPSLVVLPPNTMRQMAAYLATRSQITCSWVQLTNQYATATPAVRQAAFDTWCQQNAGQIEQLKQWALALSQAFTIN